MISSQVVPQGYRQTKVGVIPEDWDVYRIDTILERIRKISTNRNSFSC